MEPLGERPPRRAEIADDMERKPVEIHDHDEEADVDNELDQVDRKVDVVHVCERKQKSSEGDQQINGMSVVARIVRGSAAEHCTVGHGVQGMRAAA